MVIETELLISFATWLGVKIADKGFDEIYSTLKPQKSIDDKFYQCIEQVGNTFEKKYPGVLDNSIDYFFKKDEVFNELCKLLFINQEVNLEIISKSFHIESLPNNFIFDFVVELKKTLISKPEFNQILSNKEIYVLVIGITQDIKITAKNSTLLVKDLRFILKGLENRFNKAFDLERFLNLYKENLVNNLSELNVIGLGIDPSIKKGKRKKIKEIFIEPFMKLNSKHHLDQEKSNNVSYNVEQDVNGEQYICYNQLFDRPYNFVILGSPGAGKSLLIKSIIHDIILNDNFHYSEIHNRIPFIVELKEYHTFKRKNGGNLLKYLMYSLDKEFAISNITQDNLIDILNNQKTILFFDGLDEIFSASDKTHIRNDIETFHIRFSNTQSITTSRFIGYNEVKLNEELFCELSIKSFNQDQIKQYVNNWYSLEENNSKTRNFEAKNFIKNMDNIDNELISNPLLLTLIVILYRNNLRIPDSKLEIYQSCTNTLVDKWDANKNLEIKLDDSILQKKEPIFSDLAIWQYKVLSSKNTNVTYHRAKQTIEKSLVNKKEADEHNSGLLAELFLSYAQKRSIYFDNNFTHKTFLEYYSAFWIFTNIEKKHKVQERNKLISKYISNPFWFIVLELLINMIDKDQPDTDIVDELFKQQLNNDKTLSFLIYILPSIKNISEEVAIDVYQKSILYLIKTKKISIKRKGLFYKICNNIKSKKQNTFINSAFSALYENNQNENFYILLFEVYSHIKQDALEADFYKIINTTEYLKFKQKNPYLYQLDKMRYMKSKEYNYIKDIIEYKNLFGTKEIFINHNSRYDDYILISFIYVYLRFQFKERNLKDLNKNLNILQENSISILSLIKYLINARIILKMNLISVNLLCKKIVKKNIPDKEKTLYFLILKVVIRDVLKLNEFKIDDISTTVLIKETLQSFLDGKKQPIETIIDIIGINDCDILSLLNDEENKSIK